MINYEEIIGALTAGYLNVYVADPEKNTGFIVKLDGYVTNGITEETKEFCYSDILQVYASHRVYKEDQALFVKSLLPETLLERFSDGRMELEFSYRAVENGELHYYSAHYIRLGKQGDPLRLVAGFRNVDALIAMQKKKQNEGLYRAYQAVAGIYLAMYRVNVQNNTYSEIKSTAAIEKCRIPNSYQYDENARQVMKTLSEESCYEAAMAFVNRTTLEARMEGKNRISMNFTGRFIGRCRLHFLREDVDGNGRLLHAVFAVEMLEEESDPEVFEVLARNFENVFRLNITTGKAKILKLERDIVGLDRNEQHDFDYQGILQRWVSQRVHPEDQAMLQEALSVEHLREVFPKQDEYIGQYRTLGDGEPHYYQFNLSKMRTDGYVILGFQNIDAMIEAHLATERKEREKEAAYRKQLLEAVEEAERANHAKTGFLQRMSHDIRTPINGIRGMLDIAERYRDDPKKRDECRVKIRECADLLLELVNEVLDMGKLESGEIVLENVSFDLGEVMREIRTVVENQAASRGIQIVEPLPVPPQRKLVGSPAHLKRLLMNILSNAVKYNRDNGKIYFSCREELQENGKVILEFTCRDTGIGISEEFQKHIFEPFTQEHSDSRTKFSGTGLGMPIAKNLAEKMGGSIRVESKLGVGTTFVTTIPFRIDREAANDNAAQTMTEKPRKASIRGFRILLTEDNSLNMEIAEFLLREEGAEVTKAWNGQEALELFRSSAPGRFDAILMDIMMPVMDGHQATREIRSLARPDAKSIPIIAMTANAFTEDKLLAKEAGMDAHVAKPLNTKLLIETIAELVDVNRHKRGY